MAASESTVHNAEALADSLAGPDLSYDIARLYSHRTRIESGGVGLGSWNEDEGFARATEAAQLVEAAILKRDNDRSEWERDLRRAGEIFEWLSSVEDSSDVDFLQSNAAACYQLGGYPARASTILGRKSAKDTSDAVAAYLRGDFLALQIACADWFASNLSSSSQVSEHDKPSLDQELITEVVRSLSVLAAWARWGDDQRLEIALRKLKAISVAMLYGPDHYSWQLSRLVSLIASVYRSAAIRQQVIPLVERLTGDGKEALDRYVRTAFRQSRFLTWPSQSVGIQRVSMDESFALCTPTGSGKTLVAEIAILYALFRQPPGREEDGPPLVIYLVPSRALAAEVESTLSTVLRNLGLFQANVTSMYGGSDWGVSDSLLDLSQPTVAILTQEKAEALIRFIGHSLLDRLQLLVVDEAHSVLFKDGSEALSQGGSRSLRLESLVARIRTAKSGPLRVIALSAVSRGYEQALASWVARSSSAEPSVVDYRSTRQLIGSLSCLSRGRMRIDYDLLDGQKVTIDGLGKDDRPYVPDPYPPCPDFSNFADRSQPDKFVMPYLLWAALHLSAKRQGRRHSSVLLAVPQRPGNVAKNFLELLEKHWLDTEIPNYFEAPSDAPRSDLLGRCFRVCEDYFGLESYEYRLLKHGIAVHHGKMPGPMSRLIVELVQKRVVNIVVATSTLSEGVNLPFETVLVSSLIRYNGPMSPQEFQNLAGRAGRPGTSIEGQVLVLLDPGSRRFNQKRNKRSYSEIIESIANGPSEGMTTPIRSGALISLIAKIHEHWRDIVDDDSEEKFLEWLEKVSLDGSASNSDDLDRPEPYLDALDGLIVAAICEQESDEIEITRVRLEEVLRDLWRSTYSAYVADSDETVDRILFARGNAILDSIYPSKEDRNRIYRAGLVPRRAKTLVSLMPELQEYLLEALAFVSWSSEERVQYIAGLTDLVGKVPDFSRADGPRYSSYHEVLEWWLAPEGDVRKPSSAQVSVWYDYAAKNFTYKFLWGLGAAFGLLVPGSDASKSNVQKWEESGLPWAAFWIKDMVTWGVTDPVAAFALYRKTVITRAEAREFAAEYWATIPGPLEDAHLDPRRLSEWFDRRESPFDSPDDDYRALLGLDLVREFDVDTHENAQTLPSDNWRVLPAIVGEEICWLDVAGYLIGTSPLVGALPSIDKYDFRFDRINSKVKAVDYIPPF